MRYFLWHLRGGIAGFSPDFTWIHKGKTAKLLKPNHRLCFFAYIFEMMTYTIQNWINEKWKDDKYTNSIFEMTILTLRCAVEITGPIPFSCFAWICRRNWSSHSHHCTRCMCSQQIIEVRCKVKGCWKLHGKAGYHATKIWWIIGYTFDGSEIPNNHLGCVPKPC